MGMTDTIAEFILSFDLPGSPPDLLPRVRETFLDSFGVMLAGSREESARIAGHWVKSQGRLGGCSVLADGGFRASRMPPLPTVSRPIHWTMIILAIRAR